MKRNSRLILFATFLIGIVYGCAKDKDFRDKHTGSWVFDVAVSKLNIDSIGHHENFSYQFQGEIKKDEPEALLFIYGENTSIKLTVDEAGELSNFPTHYCSGKFIGSDSLYLYLRWGGLGGFQAHVIHGKK